MPLFVQTEGNVQGWRWYREHMLFTGEPPRRAASKGMPPSSFANRICWSTKREKYEDKTERRMRETEKKRGERERQWKRKKKWMRMVGISGNEEVWKFIPVETKQKGPVALLSIWPIQTAAVLTQLIAGWVSTRHKATQAPPKSNTHTHTRTRLLLLILYS